MYYFGRRYTEFTVNGMDIIKTLMISKLYLRIGSISHPRWFDRSGKLDKLSNSRYILDLPIGLKSATCDNGFIYGDCSIRRNAISDVISKGIITSNKIWEF